MDTDTIKQLNSLNQKFYATVAESFSESRNSAWEGWEKITQYIKPKNILDLGCGNGRFLEFLNANFASNKFNYLGVDNSQELLKIAESKFKSNFNFEKTDIIDLLINNKLEKFLAENNYDLIVAFGLMHHVPSLNYRKKLIKILSDLLAKDGILILAFWQFHKSKKLMRKVVNPNLININKNNLEENDFILDWQRGEIAYRYCHSFTDSEIEALVKESGLKLVAKFNADGKEKTNQYVILKN